MQRPILLIVLGLIVSALSAEAQVLPGNILGVVRDESGAVLPGATVTLSSPALPGGPVTAVTGAQGEYRVTGLPPGTYAIQIALSGFVAYDEIDLRVTVGGTTERNVRLPCVAHGERHGDGSGADRPQTNGNRRNVVYRSCWG
jgi:hypothetical protein